MDEITLSIRESNKVIYFESFEPKTEEEKRKHKAQEEYKQKFFEDVAKLKAKKAQKNENYNIK